jgi:hypothetical protein
LITTLLVPVIVPVLLLAAGASSAEGPPETADILSGPSPVEVTCGSPFAGILGSDSGPELGVAEYRFEIYLPPGAIEFVNPNSRQCREWESTDLAGDLIGAVIGNFTAEVVVLGGAPWDVNGDGYVNEADMMCVYDHFGETGETGWIPEDVKEDGRIDVLDMIIIGQHWSP